MSDDGDRKYDPTPQRREQFRKEGRFARARDASGLAATAAVLAMLLGSRGTIDGAVRVLFAHTLGDAGALVRGDASGATRAAEAVLAAIALPAGIAAALAAAGIGLAQAGLHIETDALGFKPERLNPLPRLKRLLSPKQGSVEVIFSLLRIGVVGYVAYRTLVIELPDLVGLTRSSVESGASRIVDAAVRVVLSCIGALGVIAAADYAQSKFSLSKEMKMTLEELKQETRQQEGDPKAKARMRARARAIARKRALSHVKTADVVVANPTHISVALRYGEKDPAPIVVAKGHDDVAMAIRAEARKHGIPILENRPLARALDAEVRVGQPVPAAHFVAVARVLAFVYRLRGRRGTKRA